MIDNASDWVLANAYIARHHLKWSKHMEIFIVQGHGFFGNGGTLMEAVLDFQKNSGVSWGGYFSE